MVTSRKTATKTAARGAASKAARSAAIDVASDVPTGARGGASKGDASEAVKEAADTTAGKTASAAFADLGKLGSLVEKFKVPGIDLGAIVESQRKDLEALAEANRQAYEGIKALAERRSEILQDTLVQWQEAMKDMTDKDALAQTAARVKTGVQQAIENFKELADMEAQSRSKAWKVVQDRFQENLANLQKLLRPK